MESIEYKRLTIKVVNDDSPLNPRQDYDQLGTISIRHKRYDLSDKGALSVEEINEDKDFLNKYICIGVYAYEHGGIVLSLNSFPCPWDSGQVGYIYVSKEKVKKEYSAKRLTHKLTKKVIAVLEQEIKDFNAYLSGEVFGYSIADAQGEELDSCWGFLGYDYCLEVAKEQADFFARERDGKAWRGAVQNDAAKSDF